MNHIESFDLYKNNHPNNEQTLCVICHNNYISTDSIIEVSKCSHIFHSQCLEEWFDYNYSCPLCREQLVDISIAQYIILYLSLFNQPLSPHRETTTLKHTAFICVFLHILITNYKTPAEYNMIKEVINNEIHMSICVDGETLPDNINILSLTGVKRELKMHMPLLRSLLLQSLWTETDPYHIYDPPNLPHGNRLFMHPYLLEWRDKIERALGL
jgi:hypothetical protein